MNLSFSEEDLKFQDEVRSFIAETKYLDYINLLKEDKFIEASKKIIILRGTFIIKGIIIFLYEVKNLIINKLKSMIEELIKKDKTKIVKISIFHNLLLLSCSEYRFKCFLRRESFIF